MTFNLRWVCIFKRTSFRDDVSTSYDVYRVHSWPALCEELQVSYIWVFLRLKKNPPKFKPKKKKELRQVLLIPGELLSTAKIQALKACSVLFSSAFLWLISERPWSYPTMGFSEMVKQFSGCLQIKNIFTHVKAQPKVMTKRTEIAMLARVTCEATLRRK